MSSFSFSLSRSLIQNPGKLNGAGSAEKHTTFRLSGTSTVTSVDDRKHAFCVRTGQDAGGTGEAQGGADDELVLCAVDKGDMDEWVAEIEAAVEALRGKVRNECMQKERKRVPVG